MKDCRASYSQPSFTTGLGEQLSSRITKNQHRGSKAVRPSPPLAHPSPHWQKPFWFCLDASRECSPVDGGVLGSLTHPKGLGSIFQERQRNSPRCQGRNSPRCRDGTSGQ